MNLRTKLENREGKWIRVYFMDGFFLTGKLRSIGSDYLELESYTKTEQKKSYRQQPPEDEYGRHLIPLSLIKYLTIEAGGFLEEEKRYLQYLTLKSSGEDDYNQKIPDLEQ